MKKTRGFTLVELVVVIAIIGVLAAILVPSMLNYVRKSRLRSANTNAKTAYNAVAEFITERGTYGESKDEVITSYGNQVIDCHTPPAASMTESQLAVHDMLSQNGISSGWVWVAAATINGQDSFYVQWTNEHDPDNNPHPIFGQFPDAITWDNFKNNNPAWKSYNDENGPVATPNS